MAAVGILSSIAFTGTNLADGFREGFGGDPDQVKDKCGYDPQKLHDAIVFLNANVDLIVTVGGLTAALQAAQHATKPFISLVGNTSNTQLTSAPNFQGAVDLGSVQFNNDRVDFHKHHHHINENKTCLLLNKKSRMSDEEAQEWPNNNIQVIEIDENTTTDRAAVAAVYDGAFTKITQNGWKAVIISADPFFSTTADVLVEKADDWVDKIGGRRVCYPFQEYAKHRPKKRTLYGPVLQKAYMHIGDKAAHARRGIELAQQIITP
jgi:hypothetical protein